MGESEKQAGMAPQARCTQLTQGARPRDVLRGVRYTKPGDGGSVELKGSCPPSRNSASPARSPSTHPHRCSSSATARPGAKRPRLQALPCRACLATLDGALRPPSPPRRRCAALTPLDTAPAGGPHGCGPRTRACSHLSACTPPSSLPAEPGSRPPRPPSGSHSLLRREPGHTGARSGSARACAPTSPSSGGRVRRSRLLLPPLGAPVPCIGRRRRRPSAVAGDESVGKNRLRIHEGSVETVATVLQPPGFVEL